MINWSIRDTISKTSKQRFAFRQALPAKLISKINSGLESKDPCVIDPWEKHSASFRWNTADHVLSILFQAPGHLFYQLQLVRRPLFRSSPLTESLEQAMFCLAFVTGARNLLGEDEAAYGATPVRCS